MSGGNLICMATDFFLLHCFNKLFKANLSMRERLKFRLPMVEKATPGRIFSKQAGEICQIRQNCSSTVDRTAIIPVKYRHQRNTLLYVEVLLAEVYTFIPTYLRSRTVGG